MEIKITLNEVAHSIFYAPLYVAIEKDFSNVQYYKMRSKIKWFSGDIQGAINDLTSLAVS